VVLRLDALLFAPETNMNTWHVILLATLAAPIEDHERTNPIYRELRQTGVAVGGERARLPAPTMADGLSAAAQEEVLKKVAGEDYPLEELTRPSPVAPYLLHIRDVAPSGPKVPTRAVDVAFIAYGDLKTVASKAFLDRVLELNREGGKAHALTPEELAKRHIAPSSEVDREGYASVVFPLLDRVQITGVGHSFWSEGPDSLVAAAVLDSRFNNDPDLPNQWRPIIKDRDGAKELGKPEPYNGAGYYVKVTRLQSPKGALFVEAHLIFTEPRGWFGGANLLRSKLPPVIQSQARAFRRELQKAAR
jgi:hypothetical protein